MNWANIDYLSKGSAVQQRAFRVLKQLDLFETLSPYNPVLAGTLPLDIFIPGSDIDIICEVYQDAIFEDILRHAYAPLPGFTLERKTIKTTNTILCTFHCGEFPVEIFGQPVPTNQQFAYRHLTVESILLKKHGDQFREKIISLKKAGMKTEPAFAEALKIKGDPYQELLRLYD